MGPWFDRISKISLCLFPAPVSNLGDTHLAYTDELLGFVGGESKVTIEDGEFGLFKQLSSKYNVGKIIISIFSFRKLLLREHD